ncbi:MAG TPA: peptidylprolyl isomerase [Sphingomicrobium sp.]
MVIIGNPRENSIVGLALGGNGTRALIIGTAVALGLASGALAQSSGDPSAQEAQGGLKLPENPQVFGNAMPSVVKATAIVNGDVITQTDVDQRLAFLAIANGSPIPQDQVQQLRDQVLRNLIDETLEIQAAKADKIEVKSSDIDKTVARVAQQAKKTPAELAAYLQANGSDIKSMRRQIEGEIAWTRLQHDKIEVTVGDDEVKAVLDKLNASKGTEEYRVGEIYLSATPATEAQTLDTANKILAQIRGGASFEAYARQYSEASTKVVGGDLGWIRPEQLPTPLATALRDMPNGAISNPIQVPGGYSIIAVLDTRKILTADPRDAILNLKQVSVTFPKGTTKEAANQIALRFADAAQHIGGCGGAEKLATDFHGEIVSSDQKLRDLPPAVQRLLLPMQVGQATQPFGSLEDGVRVLVVCGRDQIDAAAPSYDDIYNQLNDERVNSRANRYLRDLRRDAVIEYR